MPKKEAPIDYLRQWIPEAAAQLSLDYLNHYGVHLTITRERKSVLGDYRHATRTSNHRISVNGNLNPYSFLITLIHELAHLVTFMEYGNQVQSHGKEKSLHNLPASSCADEDLMRVLKKHDKNAGDLLLVEQIPEGGCFSLEDGRVFRKGKKLRKRYQCVEIATGKLYLFSPIYEVRPAS